jgi:hypothetical protein
LELFKVLLGTELGQSLELELELKLGNRGFFRLQLAFSGG